MEIPVKLVALACGLGLLAFPQKKDETQTLQLPRDLPTAVEGDPRNFTFHVTPLSAKGLLTRQVRDALSALVHQATGDTILKIRAFVAGSGDARRVRDLVSEFSTDYKQALPVLSLVQAGGLPLEGAQVVLEGIAVGKKEVSRYGLALVSAQSAWSESPLDAVEPLAAKSLGALREAVKAAGSDPADVTRVTCFLSSLDGLDATRKLVAGDFPGAAANFVQTERAPARALAACEAVARLRREVGVPLAVLNPEGLPREAGQSQVALVGASKVVLSGSQVSFGFAEADARLAFERLEKSLEQAGASTRGVAFAEYYALSAGIAEQVRKVRGEFFDAARPPAGSLEPVEGLPAMDAGFAIDVVAVKWGTTLISVKRRLISGPNQARRDARHSA
jgi:enamine deaminase RidA (YjgF/YER057c/UK114 family)